MSEEAEAERDRIYGELRELWRKPPQYREWSAIARICGRDKLGRRLDEEDQGDPGGLLGLQRTAKD